MKPTAGYAKPRRIAAPRRTRLNLQRRPKPEPKDDLEERQRNAFWKWVLVIALLHALVILGAFVYFELSPAPKPPEQFISLLPPGELVKGTAGAQQAHKLGGNTPAAPSHHAAPPPPAPTPAPPTHPKPVTPPVAVKSPPPTPVINNTAPPIAPVKPVTPKPTPPKPNPKVKVDLHEVERADAAETPPKPAKHHAKKPEKNSDDAHDDAESSPDNTGLSKEQIAQKLGEKLNASGSRNAIKSGVDGSSNTRANAFAEFYASIRSQINDEWVIPNIAADVNQDPVIHIYVEKDGHVPADSVRLISSSGNAAYDESALQAARNLGYLHEPLPDGCPPDISVTFKPNR